MDVEAVVGLLVVALWCKAVEKAGCRGFGSSAVSRIEGLWVKVLKASTGS